MNRPLLIAALLLAFAIYSEARIVTYTATSTISQQEADKQAMAGIALQIRADVTASHTTTKSEVQSGNQSKLDKTYSETNKVHSSLILNGVVIAHGEKQNGNFVSTATLDIDKVTAPTRLKIREIQKDAAAKDSLIQMELAKKNFASAIRAFRELSSIILPYDRSFADLSIFENPDDSYLMNVDVQALENQISDALAKLKISFRGPVPQKSRGDSIGPITISVSDDDGPIKGIPVYAEQKKQILSELKTDEMGDATFHLRGIDNKKGSHSILFEINLPAFDYSQEAYRVLATYTSEAEVCKYELICSNENELCPSIEDMLAGAGFENTQGAKALKVTISESTEKNLNSTVQSLKTVQIQLDLSGKDFHFFIDTKGVGTSELSAKEAAVKKIKADEIKIKAANFCKSSK